MFNCKQFQLSFPARVYSIDMSVAVCLYALCVTNVKQLAVASVRLYAHKSMVSDDALWLVKDFSATLDDDSRCWQ